MSDAEGTVYHLALRGHHAANGATFRTRGGWSMPEQYGAAAAEYSALRERVALIDRSSRSRFIVSGTDAAVVLERTFQGHVTELEEGRAMRTVALDTRGRIRDLALIARTGGIAYLVTGEPRQRWETLEGLTAALDADFDCRIDDRTESTCAIELAGPAAEAAARGNLGEGLPPGLPIMHCAAFEFHGFRSLVVRSSDSGEDGFLFMFAPAVAQHVMETLVGAGVRLCGQAAAECARVEACIPAFEPDLEPGLTPAEADLDVLLGIEGGDHGRILSALLLEEPAIAPAGSAITSGGEVIGDVRSCVRSFGLSATIALGIIDARAALPGRECEIAGARAAVVAKPFLRRRSQP